jgi:hypothetical protein
MLTCSSPAIHRAGVDVRPIPLLVRAANHKKAVFTKLGIMIGSQRKLMIVVIRNPDLPEVWIGLGGAHRKPGRREQDGGGDTF